MLRICVILFLFLDLAALGQDQNLDTEVYVGEEVPIGVTFYSILIQQAHDATEGESNVAVEHIQQRLKVDFNTADDVLAIMLETKLAIDKDTNAIKRALACMDSDPYEIFTQFYDVNEDVGQIHYERFIKRFDSVTADYFEDWIERRKHGGVYSRIDHQAMYETQGGDAAQDLKEMCQRGWE